MPPILPHVWAREIGVISRPAPGGGYEAMTTSNMPHDVQMSARTDGDGAYGALEAFYDLTNALISLGFSGEILHEDVTKPGPALRERLRRAE